ncbi:MAG: hypothetical protein Q6365_020115, partial [Candidatus Sigynarchaeota archaeon]
AEAAMAAIELLVKALVLAFVYLMFLFFLVAILGALLFLIPVFCLIGLAIGADEPELAINYIRVSKDGILVAAFLFEINTILVDYFDIYIPNIEIIVSNNKADYHLNLNGFMIQMVDTTEPPTGIFPFDEILISGSNSSSNSQVQKLQSGSYSLPSLPAWAGITTSMGIIGAFMLISGALANTLQGFWEYASFAATLVVLAFTWVFLISDFLHDPSELQPFFLGLTCGMIITCLICMRLMFPILSRDWSQLVNFITYFSLVLSGGYLFALLINRLIESGIITIGLMIADVSTLFIGFFALGTIRDDTTRYRTGGIYVIVTFALALVLSIIYQNIF